MGSKVSLQLTSVDRSRLQWIVFRAEMASANELKH